MLISFIIPVYNAEQYLPTCLDSILSQELDSVGFEIILVEDQSTDRSLHICRDYCSRYTNVALIENERNLGPGRSRNKGFMVSKGEYLHFVDSDDYLLPNSLRSLLSLEVISHTPDVIRFRSSDKPNTTSSINKILYEGKYDDSCSWGPSLSAWHYWFRRQFIIDNNICFVDIKTGQDAFYTFSALSCNPFIVDVSTILYFYRHNNNSITSHTEISYVHCLFSLADEIKNASKNPVLSKLYLTEVYKDIITRFYKCRRTLVECIEFKNKMKTYDQYSIITEGSWYLQLSRLPFLLYIYFMIKR